MPRGPDITVGSARRRAHLKQYGMTLQQFTAMFRAQNGVCAICKCKIHAGKDTLRREFACVDHDHRTKKVRALLCHSCNSALGFLYDDPILAEKVAVYLRYHQT